MDTRYSRQTMLWGEDAQLLLANSSALIVGAGGLGSPVALYLAAAGVGRIGIVDPDTVSLSNLQRQILYSESELGLPKAHRAAVRLKALNSEVEVVPFATRFDEAFGWKVAAEYDVIIDCTDNYATRYAIDSVAAHLGIPWVYGAISGLEGQVSVMNAKAGTRFATLFPEREALSAVAPSAGAVAGPCPGVVGSIQALEAIRLLSNQASQLDGNLLSINLINYQFNLFSL